MRNASSEGFEDPRISIGGRRVRDLGLGLQLSVQLHPKPFMQAVNGFRQAVERYVISPMPQKEDVWLSELPQTKDIDLSKIRLVKAVKPQPLSR